MSQPPPSAETPDSPDDDARDATHTGVTNVELDDVIQRRASPRQRFARTAAVLSALLIVVGLLAYSSSRPIPSPSLVDAQAGPIVLASNVNFGSVTLNGKPLAGSPPLILPLRAGRNQITLNAPPFLSKSCQVSASGDLVPGSDCLATGLYATVEVGNTTVHPGRVIVMPLTSGDLPHPLEEAARAVVDQALADASAAPLFAASALPGELLGAGATWPVAIAGQPASRPLQGNVRFGLYDPTDYSPRSRPCPLTLCAGAAITENAPADAGPRWNVVADAYFEWSFVAQEHATLAVGSAYPLAPPPEFPLTYQAASGWRVDILPAEADRPLANILAGGLCGAGAFALRAQMQQREDQVVVLQDRTVGGCELELRRTATSFNDGVFLWRFGVLLAADANAHASMPDLPVAPAVELAQFAAAPQ